MVQKEGFVTGTRLREVVEDLRKSSSGRRWVGGSEKGHQAVTVLENYIKGGLKLL